MTYVYDILLVAYIVIVAATIIAVLLDNKQPAKTIAWLMVLIFIPVIGWLLYVFFGQNVRKQRLMSQRSIDQLTKRSMMEYDVQGDLRLPEKVEPLVRLFANLNVALPFKDNQTQVLSDGYAFTYALLKAFAQAKSHIHLETYIIEDDPLGNLIADALIAKAREGVEVRLIYDDVGCWKVKERFFERMRDEGIDIHAFMPVRFPAFTSKVNYRNHRKLCVVDGKTGFIGGMNIALRYVKGDGKQTWHDIHLRVEGGGVYAIQRAFLVDWYFVDRTLLTQRRFYPPVAERLRSDCVMQVVTSSPIAPWPEIMQGYARMISQAQKYVYIETPYFLPTEIILFALQTAAHAGIDVRLIVPRRSDAKLAEWASRSYLLEAMDAGVKVYLYGAGFNHSKMMVSDDLVATVGSTNVDFRSFENNFEANAFFYDEDMALRLKCAFLSDLQDCEPLTPNQLLNRPITRRLFEGVVRLLSPLL